MFKYNISLKFYLIKEVTYKKFNNEDYASITTTLSVYLNNTNN